MLEKRTDKEIIAELYPKFKWSERFYNWVKRHCTHQIFFISNKEELDSAAEDLKTGEIYLLTDLEKRRIREYKEDMRPGVPYYLRHTVLDILSLIKEVLLSNTDIMCFFFMILALLENADFLSVVYAISILGYALIKEDRPSKDYWNFMQIYAFYVIAVKFLLQLNALTLALPKEDQV